MRTPGLIALLATLLLSTVGGPAASQIGGAAMPCDERGAIADRLGKGYAEAPVSLGVQSNGHLIEVFSSARTGTWTIVSTSPNGLACVVAAGEGWQTLGSRPPLTPS